MKYVDLLGLLLCPLLLSGCATMSPENRQLYGMQTGGMIGSVSGSIIGDRIGGWGGSLIGSVVGGVAGSAIGAAVTSPENQYAYSNSRSYSNDYPNYNTEYRRNYSSSSRAYNNVYIKDIILEDENGNRRIDRNERCCLTFIIKNEGRNTVSEIMPELKGQRNARYIKQSPAIAIRNIRPGETIRYQVKLWASPSLKNGEAQYTIRLNSRNNGRGYEETFTVPTSAY